MNDEQIQNMWLEFKTLLLGTNRENIDKLVEWLDLTDFKYAPASTQYHLSCKGGLLKHSLNVYYAMQDFKHWIEFLEIPKESVIITALLHDICKVNCYTVSTRNVKNEEGQWITVPFYSWDEQEPLGHGAKSVMLINEYGVKLSKVERAMIVNHMGFTSNDDERRVSKLFRICPQSVVLHCADLEATMMLESYDGPQRFVDKLKMGGRNLTECLELNKKPKTVIVNGTEYELAKDSDVVDDLNVMMINYNGQQVKVYAPYGDGLPF